MALHLIISHHVRNEYGMGVFAERLKMTEIVVREPMIFFAEFTYMPYMRHSHCFSNFGTECCCK